MHVDVVKALFPPRIFPDSTPRDTASLCPQTYLQFHMEHGTWKDVIDAFMSRVYPNKDVVAEFCL